MKKQRRLFLLGAAASAAAPLIPAKAVLAAVKSLVPESASAVNYNDIGNGSDTNVPMALNSKGTGKMNFTSGGGEQFKVGHAASHARWIEVLSPGLERVFLPVWK